MLPLYREHNITGIDVSPRMLAQARKRKVQTQTILKIMNGEQLLFRDNCFDYVLINHVLSVTDQPDLMIAEARRVLREGGLLLIHNHFTPTHTVKYLDHLFAPLAPLFHFRSLFDLSSLPALQLLRLQYKEQSQPLGYYQFLIFCK
jgi:phosphatidylethanolamine/phosphatidyl-N-methylethanolamine N-methyltransferase